MAPLPPQPPSLSKSNKPNAPPLSVRLNPVIRQQQRSIPNPSDPSNPSESYPSEREQITAFYYQAYGPKQGERYKDLYFLEQDLENLKNSGANQTVIDEKQRDINAKMQDIGRTNQAGESAKTKGPGINTTIKREGGVVETLFSSDKGQQRYISVPKETPSPSQVLNRLRMESALNNQRPRIVQNAILSGQFGVPGINTIQTNNPPAQLDRFQLFFAKGQSDAQRIIQAGKDRPISKEYGVTGPALEFIGGGVSGIYGASEFVSAGLGSIAGVPEARTRSQLYGTQIRGAISEAKRDPIVFGGNIVSGIQADFSQSGFAFAGKTIVSAKLFDNATRPLLTIGSKINQPQYIRITGETQRTGVKGIVGSGRTLENSTFKGIILENRLGRAGEIFVGLGKRGSIAEGLLTKRTPILISERISSGSVKAGRLPTYEGFEGIVREKIGPQSYLIETRGIGKKALAEVKPQAEVLQSQLDQGLVSRTVGSTTVGKKTIGSGGTSLQKTSNVSVAIRKGEDYFPAGIAERQFVYERTGEISVLQKNNILPQSSKPLSIYPDYLQKIVDPFKDTSTVKGLFKQSAKSVKVESGPFSGLEKIVSRTNTEFYSKGKPTVSITEYATTYGKQGSKSEIFVKQFGEQLTKKIQLGLEQARRFNNKGPMKPLVQPTQTASQSGTVLTKLKVREGSVSNRPIFQTISPTTISQEAFDTITFKQPSLIGKTFPGLLSMANQSFVPEYAGRSEERVVPRTQPFVGTVPGTVPLSVPKSTPVVYPKTVPLTKPQTTPSTIPTTVPITVPSIVPITRPITTPITQPITTPITKTVTVPLTIPVSYALPQRGTGYYPKNRIIDQRKNNPMYGPGFGVFENTRGKRGRQVSSRPLLYFDAFAYGANFVDQSIKRSFEIVPLGLPATPINIQGPTNILRTGRRSGLFTEKTQFAINTPFEKKSLRTARRQAMNYRQGKLEGFFPKRDRAYKISFTGNGQKMKGFNF